MSVAGAGGPEQPASRIDRADVMLESWDGVSKLLAELYSARSRVAGDKNIQVFPLANADTIEAMLLRKGLPLSLPVIGVTPADVAPNDGSYNRLVMRKNGQTLSLDKDTMTWTVAKLAPYVMTLTVTMLTDDVLTAWRLVDRWLANERWLFVLRYANYVVKIKCVPDKNIAFPTPQANAAGVDQYRIQTNLKVETYSGYIWRIPAVGRVDLSVDALKRDVSPATVDAILADPNNVLHVMTATIDVNPNAGEYE